MRTTITAKIGFPQSPPFEGYFKSIAYLDDRGYLRDGGDYARALVKAGFVIVDGEGRQYLDIHPARRGLFAEGIGKDADGMFSALASEGFEGVVYEEETRRSWYLSGGRSLCIGPGLRMCA